MYLKMGEGTGIQRDDREIENGFDSESEEEILYYDCLTP